MRTLFAVLMGSLASAGTLSQEAVVPAGRTVLETVTGRSVGDFIHLERGAGVLAIKLGSQIFGIVVEETTYFDRKYGDRPAWKPLVLPMSQWWTGPNCSGDRLFRDDERPYAMSIGLVPAYPVMDATGGRVNLAILQAGLAQTVEVKSVGDPAILCEAVGGAVNGRFVERYVPWPHGTLLPRYVVGK
jgi:hypothetical protein